MGRLLIGCTHLSYKKFNMSLFSKLKLLPRSKSLIYNSPFSIIYFVKNIFIDFCVVNHKL